MFSADNAGLIIAWSIKVEDGALHGSTRLWKIEKVNQYYCSIIIKHRCNTNYVKAFTIRTNKYITLNVSYRK